MGRSYNTPGWLSTGYLSRRSGVKKKKKKIALKISAYVLHYKLAIIGNKIIIGHQEPDYI